MKLKTCVITLLIVPSLSFANTLISQGESSDKTTIYTLPNGLVIELKNEIKWKWKEFVLPSGLKYVASQIISIAEAEELTFEEEIKLWINSYAEQNDSSKEQFELAKCESNLNPDAYNPYDPKGGAFGLYQYLKPTFEQFKKEAEMPELNIHEWKDQIKLTAWAFKNGKYPQHWIRCAYKIKFGKFPSKEMSVKEMIKLATEKLRQSE